MGPLQAALLIAACVAGTGCRQIFGLDEPILGTDAGADGPELERDSASIDAGPVCLGLWTAERTCFAKAPAGLVMLESAIDTDASAACTVMDTLTCTIAADRFELPTNSLVRVTGSRALVLVATSDIVIDGILDASSHTALGIDGAGVSATTCTAGTVAQPNAGGAGGSFGTVGGGGGKSGAGNSGGVAGPQFGMPTEIRAGCRAQGGTNSLGNQAGGGEGGGGVYLIAGGSITVSTAASIAANGGGGGATNRPSAGGGGGGSGGMIGLDAPTVSVTGLVWANGGGGAEGSGNAGAGEPGSDPQSYSLAAPGGAGGALNGGNGGDGALGATAGTTGADGTNADAGGGGGGGGVGIIWIHSPNALVSGTFSPSYRLN